VDLLCRGAPRATHATRSFVFFWRWRRADARGPRTSRSWLAQPAGLTCAFPASAPSGDVAILRVPRYKPTFPGQGVCSCPNLQLSISSTPGMPLFWAIRFSRK
jgi:hypothetical protein